MPQPPSNYHFIISCARSGSTWLANALNYHPDVFASEHRLFGDFCERWPNNDGSVSARITFDAYAKALSVPFMTNQINQSKREFQRLYVSEYISFLGDFIRRHSTKTSIVDKVTPYRGTSETVVNQIETFFPDAKLVRLIRDGRDVLTSGAFDWLLKDGTGTDRYHWLVAKTKASIDRFFDDSVIERWANEWIESVVAPRKYIGEGIEVRYEQMKENMPSELRNILQFFGVKCSLELARNCAEQSSFEKSTGRATGEEIPTAKTRKGVVGDWKNYFTKRDGQLFHSIAGDLLIELGYADNKDWHKTLPEALSKLPERI